MRRGCGFANPPADGTPERETVDRFRDFLAEAGPAPIVERAGIVRRKLVITPGPALSTRSPAARYRIKFLAWRVGQVAR